MRKTKGVAQLRKSTRTGTVSPHRASMIFKSQWGWIGIVETANGIVRIVFPQSSRASVLASLHAGEGNVGVEAVSPRLRAAKNQLTEYMAGTRKRFRLPLDLKEGTKFQRRVWTALQAVRYGELRSYQELASRVGGRHFARAVGGAVGSNPLPIVIPCHRIVAQDGSLGGFSCGLPAKRRLLAIEGSLSRLHRNGQRS